MTNLSHHERLEKALEGDHSLDLIANLAREFKAEGMTQSEMYRLFDQFRLKHEDDANESRYDAVLDTMDIITGWCTQSRRLFDTIAPAP